MADWKAIEICPSNRSKHKFCFVTQKYHSLIEIIVFLKNFNGNPQIFI